MQQVKVNLQTSNEPKSDFVKKLKKFIFNNIVTILFVVLCLIGVVLSKQPISFIVDELITRIARNSFLVLSLIIPVIAGMGLNFGIVIGAMAGQIAIIAVTHWQITGIWGFLLCVVLSTPLSILFGYATGKLLNKTKGQEMIASMILGYFANGLYQLLFLFLVGTIIPMKNLTLVLSGGVGIKNTVDLDKGIKYALDGLWKFQIFKALVVLAVVFIAYYIYKLVRDRDLNNRVKPKYYFLIGSFGIIGVLSALMINVKSSFMFTTVPVITLAVIAMLCIFNIFIVKTKLGQDFRAAGQDMHIANVAGINVNRTRLIAIIISTVLAGWGQLVFLQNIGTLNTYGSHEQVGMFAIAALLIGGASVTKATNSQAIIGTILFHTLFIVSPQAGKNLLGSAQIGEYFRVFVAYGVIGVSLGLHAWKKHVESKQKLR
jgi:simple sugar transport system permease protein